MGRYKDYDREPRHGDYDNEEKSDSRAPGRPPKHPSPRVPQDSGSVEAIVKWFNSEKGFGFVAVVGGPEAFIHIRQLEAAGHSSVPDGARVRVRVGQGQKGPEVTEVIEVDTSTARVTTMGAPRSAPRSSAERHPDVEPTEKSIGSVKWYNADKGFGFISQDGGGNDVFVHATTVARAGLSGLAEGQRVSMQIGEGKKGAEARSIELLE